MLNELRLLEKKPMFVREEVKQKPSKDPQIHFYGGSLIRQWTWVSTQIPEALPYQSLQEEPIEQLDGYGNKYSIPIMRLNPQKVTLWLSFWWGQNWSYTGVDNCSEAAQQ